MTAVSKNMYIDKLAEVVNKLKTDIIEQSKWNLSIVGQIHILSMVWSIMTKILNSRLVILLECQNRKILLQRATF